MALIVAALAVASTSEDTASLPAAGNTLDVAAEAVGVHRVTVSRWLAGERPVEREFQAAVASAKAEFESDLVATIRRSAISHRSWRAAAWLLERSDPEAWARPSDRAKLKAGKEPNPLAPFDELSARRRRSP